MGRKTRSAPFFWASVSCTVKSVSLPSAKVVSLTISRPSSSALATKVSWMPLEYTSSFFQMTAILVPSFFSEM